MSEEQKINILISKEYNVYNVLDNINKNVFDETQYLRDIYNNISILYYEPETAKKNDYKVFYYKINNEDMLLKKSYISGKLKLSKPFLKINIHLTHLNNISEFAYVMIKTISEHIQEEININSDIDHKMIINNAKFLKCCKSIRKNIDYHLHKHLSSVRYPSVSIINLDIVIIIDDLNNRTKTIYKINCDKIFEQNNIENINTVFNWFANKSNSTVKILPVKTTLGDKIFDNMVTDNLLKNYEVTDLSQEMKDKRCLIYNTHFKATAVYKFKINNNSTDINFTDDDSTCDDNLIFDKNVSLEDIISNIEILKTLNMPYTKTEYSLIPNNVVDAL